MRRVQGWSLAEMLVALAVAALLFAAMVPSFRAVHEKARLTCCAAMMRDVHRGLMTYAADNQLRLPPFAFSDHKGNLPLSGHWGGASQVSDPDAFARWGVEWINLWALVREGSLPPARLICPGAPSALAEGRASYFPHSFRYSTFCLRFPPSEDLFAGVENLSHLGGGPVLSVYALAAGGQRLRCGTGWSTVPQVVLGGRYRIAESVSGQEAAYHVSTDALLSDGFWRQDHSAEAPGQAGLAGYPVRDTRCHGRWFNVLYGQGIVRAVEDDGTVEANSVLPGGVLPDDRAHCATYAERVWQRFDAAGPARPSLGPQPGGAPGASDSPATSGQ